MAGEESVLAWLERFGVGWRLIHASGGSTATVEDAARFLGVDRSRIVKTLIVVACGSFYAVVVPGDKRLDFDRFEGLVGCRPRLATPSEVLEATGYQVGGVPPVALPENVRLVVDESLLGLDRVYGGGGRDGVLLEFNPRELVELLKPIVARVSR